MFFYEPIIFSLMKRRDLFERRGQKRPVNFIFFCFISINNYKGKYRTSSAYYFFADGAKPPLCCMGTRSKYFRIVSSRMGSLLK